MWSIQDVSAEELAKLFHHYRAALAHDFDCPTGEGAAFSWDRTPQQQVNDSRGSFGTTRTGDGACSD